MHRRHYSLFVPLFFGLVSACAPVAGLPCGNGIIDLGEACDDGNRVDSDACTNACQVATCGDGILQLSPPGIEQCDEGPQNSDSGSCTTACRVASCGDGLVQEGVEECDDGNTNQNDACKNNCKVAFCGDGIVQEGVEECDEGSQNSDTGRCTTQCILAACGDGVVQSGEECDEGVNNSDSGSCTTGCALAFCGDGFVQKGVEGCDDGNTASGDGCSSDCALEACGNGVVDSGEECDDGNTSDTDSCLSTCQAAFCGDGFVRAGVEECDDGNASNTDACLNSCEAASCGDGFVQSGVEQCDDGNQIDTDSCTNLCKVAFCGDGVVQAGVEECDDGNASDSDACLNTCQAAFCGDGFVRVGVEACDDGNQISADGCEPNCTLSAPPELVITFFSVEYHDQDLEYFLVVENQGGLDITTPIKVDVYHDLASPPGVGATGDLRALISSLPAGGQAAISLLLPVAEPIFDTLDGPFRNDFAQVDPLGEIPESNESNNVAGPLDGRVLRDFCAPCNSNADCDFGACVGFGDTDESFCSPTCTTDADCNEGDVCLPAGSVNRCAPAFNTCHAHCGLDAETVAINTADFVANGDGTFTATLFGNSAGNLNRAVPNGAASAADDCAGNEGAPGEVFFVLRLTEGNFPAGLLGNASTANVTITTEGTSGFGATNDTVVYLRTECLDDRASAQLGCDDDSGSNLLSSLTVNNLAKGAYVIVVDGFNATNEGNFVLNVTVDPN